MEILLTKGHSLGLPLVVCISMGFDKCMSRITQNSLTVLKLLRTLPRHPCPALTSLATTDLFTVFLILPFPECHTVGITQYAAFSNGLFHVVKCI